MITIETIKGKITFRYAAEAGPYYGRVINGSHIIHMFIETELRHSEHNLMGIALMFSKNRVRKFTE